MKVPKKYLPCIVSHGMFSGEYSVQIVVSPEETLSLFTDHENVKNGDGNKGLLLVDLVNEVDDMGVVVLPNESLSGETRVRVPIKMLQPA
jgi:hypothetical protein